MLGIRIQHLRDRDVCKKERIFGPERKDVIESYGLGRRKYYLNEDPENLNNGNPMNFDSD